MKQGTHPKKTHRAVDKLPTIGRFTSADIEALETLWQACGVAVPFDHIFHLSDGTWAGKAVTATMVSRLRRILGMDSIRTVKAKVGGRLRPIGYTGAEDLYDRVKAARDRDNAPDPKMLAEALRQLADMVSPL